MLNKLERMIRRYDMLQPGDHVVCAVSGGADSVALLFGMYLLREKWKITVSAAHYNHGLRGEESDRDEAFVRNLCDRLDIPLTVGKGCVKSGKKGLESAARDARYAFLFDSEGKLATAHTANDNAETVLMHLIRGTGLRGLGGIAPVCGRLIRPMLEITRDEVIAFLEEYHLSYVADSSNATDQFLRNRLRHHVIPYLEKENPRFAESVSDTAQMLRLDDGLLQALSASADPTSVHVLRDLPPSLRTRAIRRFLTANCIKEPEAKHIRAVERLVFSNRPSARVMLQNGVVVARNYDCLECIRENWELPLMRLQIPGDTHIPQIKMQIHCTAAKNIIDTKSAFTFVPKGSVYIRHRLPGDTIRLCGGTKELKKLFIDKKIPLGKRMQIPVIVDEGGVVGVYGFGVNRDRLSNAEDSIEIRFISGETKEEEII